MKLDYINPMTENDIRKALQLLKQCITEKKVGYTHADPIQQNCYISSSSIEGLYFPNTEFVESSKILRFVCVAKYKSELGIVYDYTEEFLEHRKKHPNALYEDYDFYSFNDILYTYEERKIVDKLNIEINAYNKDLQVINAIEYQTRKDGKPFENLKQNFVLDNEQKSIGFYRDSIGFIVITYRDKKSNKYYSYDTCYKGDDLQELKDFIESHKNSCIDYVARHKKELKQVHKISADIKKINDIINKYSYVVKTVIKEVVR